jgi:Major Facilitator Superfamily.
MRKLCRNGKLLIAAVWITEIGNGMDALAIASLLYQQTHSVMAFALVLSSEFVIGLLMLVFAGSVIDRGDPQKTMVFLDLFRGISLIAGGVCVWLGWGLVPLVLSIIVINIAKPFYRSAHFAILPSIVPEDQILPVNAIKGAATQAGQLIGVGLVGLILLTKQPAIAIVVDGLSFLLCGLLVALIREGTLERITNSGAPLTKVFQDWKEMLLALWSNPSLAAHLILFSGDFLFVALINLCLVPLNKTLADNSLQLSLLDGCFAVGSILTCLLLPHLLHRQDQPWVIVGAMILQAGMFLVLSTSRSLLFWVGALFGLGAGNTVSLTVFMSSLQARSSKGYFKGRIGSLRQVILSLIGAAVTPAIGEVINRAGVQRALLVSMGIVLIYAISTAVLASPWSLGRRLLTDPITAPEKSVHETQPTS